MNEGDAKNTDLIKNNLKDIDKNIFGELEASDILFIDSTYVSKINSDVNHIIFEILPLIKPGVTIHLHDIFILSNIPKNRYVTDAFGTRHTC